ncbi:NAD-dependent epimerase/dehydratase [Chondrocystis sp. NIES-4102]|nr:NAD-dependent epimerase/dehydratase [Chondrocystis sp. NIES-4102]
MKRIFITGASGCIGHYLTEALIENTNHELYLLVRNPNKLQLEYQNSPRIHLIVGDMLEIEKHQELLQNIHVAILAATAWGGAKESYDLNVTKTIALINLLNPEVCERVIYFSTASILDRQNQLLKAAQEYGHDYIRTKYECFTQLQQQPLADKIITVFPTLVFGGDRNKPYSHLSSGIGDVTKWINLIRWFKIDGSFHFIHAQDIAGVINYLVEHPEYSVNAETVDKSSAKLVLGNPAITANTAIAEMSNYFGKKIYWRIPLYIWLANIFIKVFQIQMDSWSRFSLDYRHFTHTNPVTPASFGLKNHCSTVAELMAISQV